MANFLIKSPTLSTVLIKSPLFKIGKYKKIPCYKKIPIISSFTKKSLALSILLIKSLFSHYNIPIYSIILHHVSCITRIYLCRYLGGICIARSSNCSCNRTFIQMFIRTSSFVMTPTRTQLTSYS